MRKLIRKVTVSSAYIVAQTDNPEQEAADLDPTDGAVGTVTEITDIPDDDIRQMANVDDLTEEAEKRLVIPHDAWIALAARAVEKSS